MQIFGKILFVAHMNFMITKFSSDSDDFPLKNRILFPIFASLV